MLVLILLILALAQNDSSQNKILGAQIILLCSFGRLLSTDSYYEKKKKTNRFKSSKLAKEKKITPIKELAKWKFKVAILFVLIIDKFINLDLKSLTQILKFNTSYYITIFVLFFLKLSTFKLFQRWLLSLSYQASVLIKFFGTDNIIWLGLLVKWGLHLTLTGHDLLSLQVGVCLSNDMSSTQTLPQMSRVWISTNTGTHDTNGNLYPAKNIA